MAETWPTSNLGGPSPTVPPRSPPLVLRLGDHLIAGEVGSRLLSLRFCYLFLTVPPKRLFISQRNIIIQQRNGTQSSRCAFCKGHKEISK